jgi:hypothetical protein
MVVLWIIVRGNGWFGFFSKHGAPSNGDESDGMCPLMSQNGLRDKVRKALKHSLKELNKKSNDGLSSLH